MIAKNSNSVPRGHEQSYPLINKYSINNQWDIIHIPRAIHDSPQYILVDKLLTADDVLVQGREPKTNITDPLIIELFEQLIDARQLNVKVAQVIEPYIQARKEHELTQLIEGDDDGDSSINTHDAIESARR